MSAGRARSSTVAIVQPTERYMGTPIPSMARAALRNVDTLVGRAVSIVADNGRDDPESRDDLREIARLSGEIRTNLLGVLAEASGGDVRCLAEESEDTKQAAQ